jgi:hypothetical protein
MQILFWRRHVMYKFVHIAARYIVPAGTRSGELRLAFDVEADGLVDDAIKLHCIVIADLDSDRIDTYGSEQVVTALEHLARADYLTGHNICGYDLPLLRRLHNWAPSSDCAVVDTLVAKLKALIGHCTPQIVPISKQAEVLRISRGSVYYLPRPVPEADLMIMRSEYFGDADTPGL